MLPHIGDPDAEIRSLPQCGFGAEVDFDSLITSNRFLFRVYTPKERSPFADDTEPFFLAPKFDDQVARSPIDLPKIKFSEPLIGSYAEVARHMEWTTRTSSSYISTSFSFSWSVWEAVRRYHQGIKKDVEIAVIDATALGGRAATAVQLLQKSSLAERNEQFWKWQRFSQDSQSVLVYGMIPRTAVLASIPLLQILRRMPSYFLRNDIQVIHGNPLDQVAWDYRLRKLSYRQFCQDMSKLFLGRPTEVRLRDSTAGAVRLALSFLRPFFHCAIQDEFDIAISYLRTLAITISEWPGGPWVRDHVEVRQIIESMVLALGEELREKYSLQKQAEISRLHVVIDGLEQTIRTSHAGASRYITHLMEVDSDGYSEAEFEEADEPTLVTIEVLPDIRRKPSLELPVAIEPRSPVTFQTPITPPESPRASLFITTPLGSSIPTPIFLKAVEEDAQVGQVPEALSSKTSLSSEEPASPPPTPPPRSPVFQHAQFLLGDSLVQDEAEVAFSHVENERVTVEHSTEVMEEYPFTTLGNEEEQTNVAQLDVCRDDDDDGEETDHEHDTEPEDHVPACPIDSWVAIRPRLSSFTYSRSSRSSIASIETLCEPIDFPLKRLSLASTESFEFIPPFSSFRSFGLASRTVSFSEPLSRPPLSPVTDPLVLPLPPSPKLSLESPLQSPARSRCSSSTSSSSMQSVSEVAPFHFPDKSYSTRSSSSITPALPLQTSSSSQSPSPSSPSSTTPTRSSSPISPALPLESSSSQSSSLSSSSWASSTMPILPLDLHLQLLPAALIIPPKRRISLLSPLPTQLEIDDDDDNDTNSIRSVSVTDTASYLVTGFLVGAFLTLFLFSTQRRALLVLT
ncbi:hypothetical protein GALMADRAFT_139090 [Galerina marginata CBS 339.88]|uniref:DUF7587 domain-containing protein n=1 Tax=Galerina marginata (strain CBS 339.88) TaxID=685588 RepID=A0A067TB04_GALM3|nr:hypothetical protein GALMADRAFT_139090 [Galerina marginata CBS 339.88]